MSTREVLRAAIFAALATVLVWQVISRSLAAYFAERAPEAALTLRASYPKALLHLAETHFEGDALRDTGVAARGSMTGEAPATQPAEDRLRALSQLAKSAERSRVEKRFR